MVVNDAPQRPAPMGLVTDALKHLSDIFRGEVALARAEMTAAINVALTGLALISGAAILAITALNLLAAAAVAAVVRAGLPPLWATLAVGGAMALLALILFFVGRNALKPSGLWPSRTLRGLRRDAETLKEGLIP